jgi:hypothetical protein
VDHDHIAYQLSGWYPERARGVSPDFPVLGTGQYDWQGFDPSTYTMKRVPRSRRPHAVDQKYLVSWNNKQAPGWAAADDMFTYGPLHRQQMLTRFVSRGIKGSRKMTLTQLVRAMSEPATEDLRGVFLVPLLTRAIGRTGDAQVDGALKLLSDWRASGGNRRDLDKNGTYEADAAVTLMDAWWPRLARAIFDPVIGPDADKALQGFFPYGEQRGGSPAAPDYFSGWWGLVSKDLRTLFHMGRVKGRYSRVYCGGGSRSRCRAALINSLREALSVPKSKLYAFGDCAQDADAECWDKNRWVEAVGVTVPPMLFQNRPTFQQTVEIPRAVPR